MCHFGTPLWRSSGANTLQHYMTVTLSSLPPTGRFAPQETPHRMGLLGGRAFPCLQSPLAHSILTNHCCTVILTRAFVFAGVRLRLRPPSSVPSISAWKLAGGWWCERPAPETLEGLRQSGQTKQTLIGQQCVSAQLHGSVCKTSPRTGKSWT